MLKQLDVKNLHAKLLQNVIGSSQLQLETGWSDKFTAAKLMPLEAGLTRTFLAILPNEATGYVGYVSYTLASRQS